MWINYFSYIFLPFSESGSVQGHPKPWLYCKACIFVYVCPLYFTPWAQIFTGNALPHMLLVLCCIYVSGFPQCPGHRRGSSHVKGLGAPCPAALAHVASSEQLAHGSPTSHKRMTAHAGEQPGWQETQLPAHHSAPSCWCFPLSASP